ncbi:MAG: DUF5119 domain-containing protein [Tannerella sp.]|nr:DUF5119 domain-containing protein [Tannerella sp.]
MKPLLICIILLSATGCVMEALPDCGVQITSTSGTLAPVYVVIHWDGKPEHTLPKGMTVYWFPSAGTLLSSDMGIAGGREYLVHDIYHTLTLDFYGNTNLSFRSNGARSDYEVFNVPATGVYNYTGVMLTGEKTVAEASTHFYSAGGGYLSHSEEMLRQQRDYELVDTHKTLTGDTVTVHFYPKNVLREFTFLIYNIDDLSNMRTASGAITGMSASYLPARDTSREFASPNSLASTPSTILFTNVEAVLNGQTNPRWTEADKELFTAMNPLWESSDTTEGWTGDWLIGSFYTFGPIDPDLHQFRLSVVAISNGNKAYIGTWGEDVGRSREASVGVQIDSAMSVNGTLAEQLGWRIRNGGFDIVLGNDNNNLKLPAENIDGNDGGIDVNVDGWGDIIDIKSRHSPKKQ